MTAVILPFPARPTDARSRRTMARRVPCPRCGAAKRKPCTKTGTAIVRITGPHPDRIAAAEAAAERNECS